MIAALFVDADGIYSGRPDVDPWPVERDACEYGGPWPVVAHPPCERWGSLWWSGGERRIATDGGCFEHALAAVRRFGGVLEHPAGSRAWPFYGIPKPPRRGGGWAPVPGGGWTCELDQSAYGHPARKRTWLFYVGPCEPPPLDWSSPEVGAVVARGPGMRPELRACSKRERRATPERFAEALIGLAREVSCALST